MNLLEELGANSVEKGQRKKPFRLYRPLLYPYVVIVLYILFFPAFCETRGGLFLSGHEREWILPFIGMFVMVPYTILVSLFLICTLKSSVEKFLIWRTSLLGFAYIATAFYWVWDFTESTYNCHWMPRF